MSSSATIDASGLTRWFGPVIALNDVQLSVQAPIIGLLGPNGAGKSTFIKLLVGLLKPSLGTLLLMGQQPWQNDDLAARLGYCPERHRFWNDMTALEFVQLLTRLHGFDASLSLSTAHDALSRVELEKMAMRKIKTLSHGMRQRLKLAQALAHKPEILVLDEPLTGLDPLQRSMVISLLKEEARKGVFVLVSSHVLHELEAMTRHIVMLNRGRVVAEGELEKIRELMDSHPHRIALVAKRLRALGQELLGHDDVVRVEVDDRKIVIETRRPDECYDRIGKLALDGDFQIEQMYSMDDNLEAVFKYLVEGR